MSKELGSLYVVATPIGNLEDITVRALSVLKSVDGIAAEDTRHARRLLNHYSIQKSIFSLHQFNEEARVGYLLEKLRSGQSIALISDAGTPLISDPGYITVQKLRENGIRIIPIPGASALIAALSVAGLPTDRFIFLGFLPTKSSARQSVLSEMKKESATIVCYESTHRILDCLQDIELCFPHRKVVLARELTKLFETIHAGLAHELLLELKGTPEKQKGEFVVLIDGNRDTEAQGDLVSIDIHHLLTVLLAVMPLKQAVNTAVEMTQFPKNRLYDCALLISSGKK